MKERPGHESPAGLREQAEKRLQSQMERLHGLSELDVRSLVHELGTHQIELEMQNEELRRALEELEESRSRYSELYDFSPVGYLTFDRSGIIREANLTAANMLGLNRKLLINKPFSLFIPDAEDRTIFDVHCREVLHKQIFSTCEIAAKRKDGTQFPILLESVAVDDHKGSITGLRTAISDITQRRKTEDELKRYREDLEDLVRERTADLQRTNEELQEEIAERRKAGRLASHLATFPQLNPNPVIEVDSEGRVIFANSATTTILERLGMDKEGISAFIPQGLETILKDLDRKTESSVTREVGVGDRIFSEAILLVPQLQVARIYALDITERKRAEARMKEDLAALTRMHVLSGRVMDAAGIQPLLQDVMDVAVAIMGADRGTLQLVEGDSLRIVAHHGHQQPFLEYFARAENKASACGAAMQCAERVVIPDVETSDLFAGTASLAVLREAGVRAVQSTPMISRSGALLGILTTQQRVPYSPEEHDLWRMDLLARQAADLIEHSQAEEALRASEERYRLLVDLSPDAVIVIQDGRFVFTNPAAVVLHGARSRDQMIGRLVNDFLHPDDIERVRGAVEALARERSASLNDVRVRRLDGEYTWTEGSGVAVGYDGRPAVQVIIRDITDRRKAGEELRMVHLDMERAQQVASIGSWRLDVQKNILTWSDENHSIFGIPKGTPMSYETFLAAVHPDDREYVDRQWKAGLQGRPYDIEHRLLVDGQTKWVREKAYLEFDNTGALLGGFGITQDITERKRAEASLHESEERFRHIAETSADVIFQMDPEGRLTYCSPAIRSFGYEPDNVLGRTFSEFIPHDELPSAADALQRVNSGESISLFVIRVLKSDNTVVICEVSATPIVRAGTVVGIQGIARDITERRKTEEELQRAHDELEERVQLRTSELSALNDDLDAEIHERRKTEERLARINALYSILFRVNEAIVRIHNPERLFEQTCRIVVDSGLFKMAWIGLLDPQTAKVEPIASAGDNGKYLNRVTIIARDVPEGRGPTGRAIIEGKAMVCTDIENDPAMAPFREAALREGFRSSASFPLRAGSTIVGAFNTYADSPRFFTDEEIKLLSSLVEDISFAIESMAGEKKRIEAEQAVLASAHEIEDLYNFSPCGYHSLDRDGRIVKVNDTELAWLGYGRDEVVGKMMAEFYTPESRKRLRQTFPKFLRTGSATDLEFDLVRKDGTILPVSINATAVLDKDHNFVMSRSTVFDITERKARERQTEAVNNVLKLFATTAVRSDYLNTLVNQLKIWCECSSVGIRLIGDEGDVPFAAYSGFSEGFIKQESCLILGKDSCACTRVIDGKPRKAETNFMTKGGSFVCNHTSDLCSRSLRDFYRHACIREGFSSLAVVPIRYRSKVIGAVHLADPQNNAFPPPVINFIEAITPLVGEALHRFSIEEELTASREQLRALSAHLQEALEDERTKIAREIHDELGQILTAAGMELSLMKKRYKDQPPIKKTAASVIGMLDNAVADIQRICEELRPRVLDHLGLPVAIKQEAAAFTKRTGIRCSLDLVGKIPGLTDESAVALFRIVQEALTNVARHSEAKTASIRLIADRQNIILEIGDNGKGISRQELGRTSSLGLIGMRERIREVGGEVTIKGSTGKGTHVTVKIPCGKGREKRSDHV